MDPKKLMIGVKHYVKQKYAVSMISTTLHCSSAVVAKIHPARWKQRTMDT